MNRSSEDRLHEHIGAIVKTARDGLDLLRGELPPHNAKVRAVVSSVLESLLSVEHMLSTWGDALRTRAHPGETVTVCHLLRQTQDVVGTVEELCRECGVRTEIVAHASLPTIAGMPERVAFVLLTLLEYAIRTAEKDSVVKISLVESALHQGTGIEWRVMASTNTFSERDRYHLFTVLDQSNESARGARAIGDALFDRLTTCRAFVDSMHGELWAERNVEGGIELVVLLPAVQAKVQANGPRCKLDLVIGNIAEITAQCGREAVDRHFAALEAMARGVVRPRDTVMHFASRGVISVMLHTDADSAAAVIARIRRALVDRHLINVGPQPVDYDLRVTPLP